MAQWDGFGAHWQGWRVGDLLLQEHLLRLPEVLLPGTYTLYTGLYDPETATRWQVGASDELLLQSFAVMNSEVTAP